MSPAAPKPPELDFTRISFPSDRITIKAFLDDERKSEMNIDRILLTNQSPEAQFGNLAALLVIEREIAHAAFTAALEGYKPSRIGRKDHESAWVRRENRTLLGNGYQDYGLSSGPQQSLQLVRDIEAQAVAQAKEHLGQGL